MFEYTEHDVNTNGMKTHYYRTGGDKPPFILLHGASDNGLCWARVAEALSVQYDVIMPDALGHGLSDRLGPDFTFRQHTEQVAGLVQVLNVNNPVIMGHSMGGHTAMNVAIDYPDIPRAIIFEDSWGAPPQLENKEDPGKALRQQSTKLRQLSLEKIIEEGKKQNPSWPDEEFPHWAKAKQQFDTSLFSGQVFNPRLYNEPAPDIKCPTLLIYSDAGIVSEATARRAAEVWKSDKPFRAVQIKGAGHNIRREQYTAFMRALTGFLGEIP
jgi:pimeloyl-ACP methyl ester carboxylesterase